MTDDSLTGPQLLRRTLVTTSLAKICGDASVEGRLWDAIALPSGEARVYLGADAQAALVPSDDAAPTCRVVSCAPLISAPLGADGQIELPLLNGPARITPTPDEGGLLAGRDVLLGHCNHETPAVLRDWLVWHVQHHRVTGALILDRSAPGDADRRAGELAALLAESAAEPDLTDALAKLRILFVDADIPLGAPDQGAESHPFHAADAPGKDRMDRPDPDPWRAPLAHPLILDLLRHRYLSRAHGIANLEPCDLLPRPQPGEGTVFDAARLAPAGILPLQGERIYPWSLRKGQEAAFSDHICRRFDATGRIRRWCIAPVRLPQGAICIMTRILGTRSAAPARPFWRFMALRHGGDDPSKVGQIVPKTSLVEDPELLALSEDLGGSPMRQPTDDAPAAVVAAPDPQNAEVAIVTTMKNEGPFILEWLAYHRAIGVNRFLVYTNDCSDGTDAFLRLLDRKGYVTWRDNPYRDSGMKPQHAALNAANSEPIIQGADWAICMDVDEYIAIHTGDGTLPALFEAVPDANVISITWRLFGNNDIDAYRDGFITQSFTRASREFSPRPHQAWGFKTLYRNNGLFKKLGVHRPKGLIPQAISRVNWVNGSGQEMPQDQWRNAWRSHTGTYGYDLVALNHYAVRSAESFLVKRDRGRVNHVDRDQGMAYWFRMNHNVVEDTRMQRMLPLLQAEYDRLLSDPEIAAMHESCVAAHRAKIAELKTDPAQQAFHAALTSQRTRRLSRLHGHFGANVYLAGPEAIPDDVVAREPEEDFFFTVEYDGEAQH